MHTAMSRVDRFSWKRRVPRLLALVALLAVGAFALTTASAQSNDTRPAIRIRLQFARPGGIYDPAYWKYSSDSFVNRSIFNSLVRMVPGSGGKQLAPDLATSWDVSSDGLTYTFHLRHGVQFQKGFGEMKASDVVFTFQRQLDDPKASWGALLTNIASVKALDDYTVQFVLKAPQPSFIRNAIAYRPGLIVSKAAVEKYGDSFRTHPIGTGAYTFEQLTSNNEVVLSSNDSYYAGEPPFSKITFVPVSDESTVAAALQSGELDIAYTRGNPEVAQELLNSKTISAKRVIEFYNLMQVQMSPNFKPTQNVLVRRALAYAMNKPQIKQLEPGLSEPAAVMRPPEVLGGTTDVPTYPYDPTKAKQLLEQAGYPNGFDMELMFQMREPEATIAQWLAQQWQAIGIKVQLKGLDSTTAFDRRKSGNFDVTFSATSRPGDPDLFFTDVFASDGGSNFFHYTGADALIKQARNETDETKRMAMYGQLQAKLMTELPIIPILYRAYVAAWRPPVASFQPDTTVEFWADTIKAVQ